jgi:hypothetical protein
MTTVTITYNTITNNQTGIKIGDGDHVLASNFVIAYNSFVDNDSPTTGLNNQHATEYVTAECNWWNDAAGPKHDENPYNAYTSGDAVSGNVDYIPWLIHTELVSGWNIYSTPIAAGTTTDTISEALDIWGIDSGNVTAAYYFDGSAPAWVIATNLTPLDAVYLKMGAASTIDVCFSTENTAPPQKVMYTGWNLIGAAEIYDMQVDEALLSAYHGTGVAAGLWGYGQVISPAVNQTYWTHLRDASATDLDLIPTKGYWVLMVNQGTLGGFTSTPITTLP